MINLEPTDYEIHVRNLLSEYFAILIHIDKTAVESNQSINLLLEDRAQVILNYIHANYSKNITLDDLAVTANISKSEVLRCFKAIINTSPIKYLKNFRLQNAAYMLKNSAYSIQTIYELCGFDNNSYFSKSFKEQYHCSPREYRGLQQYRLFEHNFVHDRKQKSKNAIPKTILKFGIAFILVSQNLPSFAASSIEAVTAVKPLFYCIVQ